MTLTQPDRFYRPDAGVTKQGLADYYAEVWPRIGPYVAGRPLLREGKLQTVDEAAAIAKAAEWRERITAGMKRGQ